MDRGQLRDARMHLQPFARARKAPGLKSVGF